MIQIVQTYTFTNTDAIKDSELYINTDYVVQIKPIDVNGTRLYCVELDKSVLHENTHFYTDVDGLGRLMDLPASSPETQVVVLGPSLVGHSFTGSNNSN